MILDNNASEGRTIRRYGSNIAEAGEGASAPRVPAVPTLLFATRTPSVSSLCGMV